MNALPQFPTAQALRVNQTHAPAPSAPADPVKRLADVIDAKPQGSKLAAAQNGVMYALIGPAAAYAIGATYSFIGILGGAGMLPPIDGSMLGVLAGVGAALGAGIGGWLGYRSSRNHNAIGTWHARNAALQQAAPIVQQALNAAIPWTPEPLRSQLPHMSISIGYQPQGPAIIVRYQGPNYLSAAHTELLHGFLMSTLSPDMKRIAANYGLTVAYMGQPQQHNVRQG